MIRVFIAICLLTTTGCQKSEKEKSAAVPDSVIDDTPIIIREGQAVILVPEGDSSLKIGAAVIDGKLTVSEIDPNGRSFSVTWNDAEHWSTSSISLENGILTTVIDDNGDGIPKFRMVRAKGRIQRSELRNVEWSEAD